MSVINNDSGDSVDSGNGDRVVTDKVDNNIEREIQSQIQAANKARTPLNIIGGQSKSFYGRQPLGDELSLQPHCGIIRHDPPELVLTARAGTRIVDINAHLAKHQQQLGFEPPLFIKDAGTVNSDSNSDTNPATLGGAIRRRHCRAKPRICRRRARLCVGRKNRKRQRRNSAFRRRGN